MFTKSYESKRPQEVKVSITTDRIDLYTANVPAHLQYKELLGNVVISKKKSYAHARSW